MEDELEPKDIEEAEEEMEDLDDLALGKKKPKGEVEEDSLDALADEEEAVLPEDSYDDQDLW